MGKPIIDDELSRLTEPLLPPARTRSRIVLPWPAAATTLANAASAACRLHWPQLPARPTARRQL